MGNIPCSPELIKDSQPLLTSRLTQTTGFLRKGPDTLTVNQRVPGFETLTAYRTNNPAQPGFLSFSAVSGKAQLGSKTPKILHFVLHATGTGSPQQTARRTQPVGTRAYGHDMGLVRKVALWSAGTVAAGAIVLAVLCATGSLSPTYQWFVRYFPPDVWSALAAWVAVAVGIVTVVVAGRYAKQQVEKAQDQVREAREARLDQERQAQEAIDIQVRIAEEQAQPNVVLYTELNPSAKQFMEIVIKNFGTTPAYHVKATFDPPLKATPNLVSKGKLADVPIPEFPILAPGQEWRTGWDHSISRKQHQKKWAPLAGSAESELTDEQKLAIQAHMSYTGEVYSYEEVMGA